MSTDSSAGELYSSFNFHKDKGGSPPSLQQGALYLVGTPIGNLEDISFRALRVLSLADVILAEDTRRSSKLLSYFEIRTPMISFHLHNEQSREGEVLQKLRAGKVVAVVSDAGMPGISDPGMELVEACVGAKIPVIPIPGPSAVITALVASGLPTYEFTFLGFLPPDKAARRKRLASMKDSKPTQVMFVGPHKLAACLADAADVIGPERRCVVAREMTKVFEEFYRGPLGEAAAAFRSPDPGEAPQAVKRKRPEAVVRGEVTLLIEGHRKEHEEEISEDDITAQLLALRERGASVSDATREIVEASGLRKKKIYRLALDLWKDD
ncbi:Tetrapyrrole (Corrin/Porphyrin) Methylases family protein [Klebsormidium nitens]|uniref:Tetrapyrrole (Corrin/Porphyrin) Methylases family protein n=1 Tax=Klebsormidium nitens TaxID=105231 RepID=A0A1Y1HWH5_KLENI|nr:Tetrapyrrole (Corrin/Porphyrin) Methylases family protein [Klebsormidium nitens]|eukprot:GAQ80877.1 Tetrapyrrole (Corrin/Porphyrin) Methylases family protein [Klebsormidium nitens]